MHYSRLARWPHTTQQECCATALFLHSLAREDLSSYPTLPERNGKPCDIAHGNDHAETIAFCYVDVLPTFSYDVAPALSLPFAADGEGKSLPELAADCKHREAHLFRRGRTPDGAILSSDIH